MLIITQTAWALDAPISQGFGAELPCPSSFLRLAHRGAVRAADDKCLNTVGKLDTVATVEMPKRLRITDIANATELSKSTLIRYESDGKIPTAKRDGRGWRYYTEKDRSEIIALLKGKRLI